MSRTKQHALAALLIGAITLAGLTATLARSPTSDEPFHITRGLAFWWTGDTRLSYAHPPLANLIAAVPGALSVHRTDLTAVKGWEEPSILHVAQNYVPVHYRSARQALMLGRLMGLGWLVLLSAYVYAWCLPRFGWNVAMLAIAMVGLNPTMLAHAGLVTTDFPLTAMICIAVLEGARYLSTPGWISLLRFGLAAGCAASVKFTAILPLVLIGAIGTFYPLLSHGRFQQTSWWKRYTRFLGEALCLLAVVLTVIAATYRFQHLFETVDRIAQMDAKPKEFGEWKKLFGNFRLPVPATYFRGLVSVDRHNENGHGTFFLGEIIVKGHWAYFPLLLIMKTPFVTQAAAVFGAGASLVRRWWARRLALSIEHVLFVLVPVGMFALFMRANLNIGFRHALSVVPFLAIVAARGLGLLLERRARWGQIVVGIFLTANVVECVRARDDFLGYFNVGGEVGSRVSVVGEDWGQDVPEIAQYLRKAVSPIYYQPGAIGGSEELRLRGVKSKLFDCNSKIPAGSVVVLHRADSVREAGCYRWRKKATLLTTIHHHVEIFRIPK